MIRGAICQSFKFFVVMFTLVGATFTANCQAERNAVTLECRSVNQDAIGATALHQLKLIERDRQRGEKLWSEFSLFATEQASAAKRRLTSLGLQKWWQPSAPSVSPALQQHPAENKEPDVIGPVAMMTRLVANMSALQWLEVSNFGSDLIDSGSRRMTEAKNRLQDEIQAGVVELVELSSNNVGQIANDFGVSDIFQNMLSAAGTDQWISLNSDEDLSADPYWHYYADCDFWEALFAKADNE